MKLSPVNGVEQMAPLNESNSFKNAPDNLHSLSIVSGPRQSTSGPGTSFQTRSSSTSLRPGCLTLKAFSASDPGLRKSGNISPLAKARSNMELAVSKQFSSSTRATRKSTSQSFIDSRRREHALIQNTSCLTDDRKPCARITSVEKGVRQGHGETSIEQEQRRQSHPPYTPEFVKQLRKKSSLIRGMAQGMKEAQSKENTFPNHPPDIVQQEQLLSPVTNGADSDSGSETEMENRLRDALEFLLFPPQASNDDESRRALNQVHCSLRSGRHCPSRRLERFLREIYRAMEDYEAEHEVQERACVVLGKIAQEMPSAHPMIAETGGVKQIMKAIQRYKKLDALQDKGIFALMSLTRDAAARNCILEERGVECVLRAMVEFQDVRTILKNGASTLCNLASASEVGKERIGRVDGIDAIINAMNRHETDVELQTCCCLALRNITFGSTTNQWIAGRAYALDSLIRLMKNFSKDTNVQYQGCWALANICSQDPGNKDRAGGGELIETCIAAMENNMSQTHVVEKSLSVLSNISDKNLDNQVRIGKAGGTRLILKALERYRSNETIVIRACSAIRFLCFSRENRDEVFECGGLKLLTRILGDGEDVPDIAESAILALGNAICDHKEGKKLVGRYGGIATIADVMSKHLDHEGIQENCSLALRNLSDSDELINPRLLGDSGAIDMAVYAMMGYPQNAQIQEQSCAMMFNIAFIDDNLQTMKELAVANVVEHAKELHNNSPEVRFQALALLQMLQSGDDQTSPTKIRYMRKFQSPQTRRKYPQP